MKKEKLYNPDKTGTFQMMFGFPQPGVHRPNTVSYTQLESLKQKRNENNNN